MSEHGRVVAAADPTRGPQGNEFNIPCAKGAYYGEPPCGDRPEGDRSPGWNCTRAVGHRGVHAAHTQQDAGPVRVWEQKQ